MVGEVCALSDKFSWYDKSSLSGCKVVVTRPKELSSRLAAMLRNKGAEVLELPSIVTRKIESNQRLYDCLGQLQQFQWVVLTSPTGAKLFFEELRACKIDIRKLTHIKFAVVGKATSQILEEKGIFPDLMPVLYYGEELGKELSKMLRKEDKVLIPRAKEGAYEILRELSKSQADIYDVAIYETIYEEPIFDISKELEKGEIEYAVFTSASTVEGFVKANQNVNYGKIQAICIGNKTREAAKRYQMQTYVSKEATMESLVECLEERNQSRSL